MGSSIAMEANISNNTRRAVQFEQMNRVHGDISDDSFYQAPKGTQHVRPGSLLTMEMVTHIKPYTIPPGLAISRFMYQSQTYSGRLVPVSAYILWPYTAAPHEGGIPLVVWSHDTTGVSAQCAPSNTRNLWHHFQVPFQVAQAGYAVVATDYAGLGVRLDANGDFIPHEYLLAPSQSNDLWHSIAPARLMCPELSEQFVLIGSGQGGSAVWNAAQRFRESAMEGYLGAVCLSPFTRVLDLPLDGPWMPLLVMMMVRSIQSLCPGFQPSDILNPQGERSLKTYLDLKGCNSVLFQQPHSLDILKSGWQNNKHVLKWQSATVNGGKPFQGPMLIMQGGKDDIVDADTVSKAVDSTEKFCSGEHLTYMKMPHVNHTAVMHAGARIYLDWIAQRFAERPLEKGCFRETVEPVRFGLHYQKDTNFVLTLQTGPWQAT